MLTLRPANERGVANLSWLDSRHSFSFGNYYDPKQMGFATLRVINEDKIEPNQGFGTHGHRDMEIITYLLQGELEHKDSIGNGSVIKPGDVQRMSAGTGILHSEFNASSTDPVHLLQIWILPEKEGITPSYEQKYFSPVEKQGQLRLVGSQDGREGSVTIHQAVDLYVSELRSGEEIAHQLKTDRVAWVQVMTGMIQLNDHQLGAGDGAAITEIETLHFQALSDTAEFLLFDMVGRV